MPELTCFRLLDAESPAGPLAESVRQVNAGQGNATVYTLDPVSFEQVPNAPFAYWVEEKIRRIFSELSAFESDGRAARQGLATADDFRFVRCWWEIPTQVTDSSVRRWWPFAKGGAFSPYYADLHLVVNWHENGKELSAFSGSVVRNPDFYFRAGLTWPLRTSSGMSARVLPKGCVFAHKGPAAFTAGNSEELWLTLATVQSGPFGYLVGMQLAAADAAARSYEVGVIQRTPVPSFTDLKAAGILKETAASLWEHNRSEDTIYESSHAFVVPWLGERLTLLSEVEAELASARSRLVVLTAEKQNTINQITEKLYDFKVPEALERLDESQLEEEDDSVGKLDAARILISYLVGIAFGRWATPANPEELRKPPADPFAPLPAQAPGASPVEAAKLYFTEDVSGESPLLCSCRVALRQATGLDSVDGYEQDLATRLGVTTLRDYLSRPAGFFVDHLSVYSKSRRKAPIYWPLSTKSGNFTLWVYYPKLDDQSLPKLIADVLSPKIRTLSQEIENRRATPGGKIGELEALRLELEEMRTDFLDLINRGYRPNQNDGVLITACPLAKYFRHAGFRKNLEACWKELARGDYDWSHLAMAMWPDRALEACKKDRSIAIAHGKEDLCPAEPPKAARGRKKTLPPT
jgi:hypothetical protein